MSLELPQIVAHRGESGHAPENTLTAIELAARGGARWVELDANISRDGIAFIHHDDNLDRCTDGKGPLSEKHSHDLDQLDAGVWFAESHRGEKLPRLSAVIELLEARNMGLNLEIKPEQGKEKATALAVCTQLEHEWPKNLPLLLSSFSDIAVEQAQQSLPETPRGLIVGGIPDNWQEKLLHLGCSTLHCSGKKLTEQLAQDIIKANFGLLCWTVNSYADAKRLFSWGVNSVFTDYPTSFIQKLQDNE